jgi:glycosyltransferase involved in cell wall biosynthesis
MASSPLERFEQANEFAVVPNIVSVPAGQAVEESPGTGAHLLFVGNLNFLPNLDALGYFQAAILPKLVERVPDIRVLVVGRSPSTPGAKAAVDRLRQSTHFTFAFDVPDCGDSYRRCTLSITPIRLGGGTRIKILEAFAHGCPVVSTRKGCEGLDVEDGVHLFMADDADQFAAGCLELLRNSERREKLSTHADTFVRGQHTQSVVDRILSSTVADLLSS